MLHPSLLHERQIVAGFRKNLLQLRLALNQAGSDPTCIQKLESEISKLENSVSATTVSGNKVQKRKGSLSKMRNAVASVASSTRGDASSVIFFFFVL